MAKKKRRNLREEYGPQGPRECKVAGCHRPTYARGFCQTHHRQMLTTGKVKPIRPYRERSPDTVKFAGLRVTPGCAELIAAEALARGLSVGAVVAEVLERWYLEDARH